MNGSGAPDSLVKSITELEPTMSSPQSLVLRTEYGYGNHSTIEKGGARGSGACSPWRHHTPDESPYELLGPE